MLGCSGAQRDRIYPHILQRNAEEGVFPAWLRSLNDRNYGFSKWREATLRPPRPQPDRVAREAARKRRRSSPVAHSRLERTAGRDGTAACLDRTDLGRGVLPQGPAANGNAPVVPASSGGVAGEVRVPEGRPGGTGEDVTEVGLPGGPAPPGRPAEAPEGLDGHVSFMQIDEEGSSCLGTLQTRRHAGVSEA